MWLKAMLITFFFAETTAIDLTGTVPLASVDKKCCRWSEYEATNDNLTGCPPSSIYEVDTQLCCQGKIRQMQDLNDLCCGQNTFNWKRARCCNDEVATLPTDSAIEEMLCCANQLYDTAKSFCCLGELVEDPTGQGNQCCGNKIFNMEKQACCWGLASEDPPATFTILESEGNKTACCDTTLYDPNTEKCCNGQVVGGDLDCCGGQTYSPTEELCCWTQTGTFAPIRKNTERDNCCGTGGRYTPEVDLCCNNQVLLDAFGKRDCCGWFATYDLTEELCCPRPDLGNEVGEVKKKIDPGDKC